MELIKINTPKIVWVKDTEYGKQLIAKRKKKLLKDIQVLIKKEDERLNEFLKLRKQFGM